MTISAENILKIKELERNNKISEEDFINSTSIEDQYVGIISTDGKIESVIVISTEELKEKGIKYVDLNSHLENIDFFKQKIGDEMMIAVDQNLELIEKFHSRETEKKMLGKTNKTDRSVKGGDGRKVRMK